MRSPGLHRPSVTVPEPGSPAHGRHAQLRLSNVRPWKLPISLEFPLVAKCRTCVHSPLIQALSGVNAVATPTGAPTCPPWVASRASLLVSAQCVGASPPASAGPQASTMPPPVTRQPLTGGGRVVVVVLVVVVVVVLIGQRTLFVAVSCFGP